MKHFTISLLLALFTLGLPVHAQDDSPEPDARPIRVACVGDSITYGAMIPERERWCYPALFQAMLGDGYEVKNFGVNGATLLSAGDIPYVETQAYQDALSFEPDVVVIMLGTNDTKAHNWEHAEAFEVDYVALVESFRVLAPEPRVVLMLPVPAWTQGDAIDGGRVREGVVPRACAVAEQLGCEVIDLHAALSDRQGWFPDGVHPNSFGAEQIAKQVYEAVYGASTTSLDTPDVLFSTRIENPEHSTQFDFHEYSGIGFVFDGVEARVVMPRVAAAGRPWVWHARFWGHEPQADLAMLERGWHVVYCDVGSLYGNAEAVERWDGFYQAMRDAGLGEDLVLEGMSRGGLIIYNWAKQNPTLVSAIYADAPVCDLRSWPGGLGEGSGSAGDWQRAMAAYGLETEDDIASFTGNPIDGLDPLAEHGVPLLHIVGDADEVVPVSENTAVLEQRYRALGGDITVIHKPGVGHHPHSLPDPTPIVDFFLEATDRKVNFATVPMPSVEYRGGSAGWGGGTWWDQHEAISALGEGNDIDVVFLGDSITQSFTGVGDRLSRAGGNRTFDQHFGDLNAASFGISGDRTEHLLYRIAHGNFEHIDPRVIVLMIGVNNINAAGHTGEETAQGTRAVVAALREHEPQAHVIVLGCFPTGPQPDSPNRIASDVLHDKIADIGDDDDQITYLDLRPLFLNADGTLNGRMAGDAIHLTGEGYVAWADAIGHVIRDLLAE
ncbi:MAG: GDSL-type esterase/lipase family protein [Planctomycetota bacterium]